LEFGEYYGWLPVFHRVSDGPINFKNNTHYHFSMFVAL
jgi:hypothetical protein